MYYNFQYICILCRTTFVWVIRIQQNKQLQPNIYAVKKLKTLPKNTQIMICSMSQIISIAVCFYKKVPCEGRSIYNSCDLSRDHDGHCSSVNAKSLT